MRERDTAFPCAAASILPKTDAFVCGAAAMEEKAAFGEEWEADSPRSASSSASNVADTAKRMALTDVALERLEAEQAKTRRLGQLLEELKRRNSGGGDGANVKSRGPSHVPRFLWPTAQHDTKYGGAVYSKRVGANDTDLRKVRRRRWSSSPTAFHCPWAFTASGESGGPHRTMIKWLLKHQLLSALRHVRVEKSPSLKEDDRRCLQDQMPISKSITLSDVQKFSSTLRSASAPGSSR